ncbi:uncharacterized protein TNCV_1965311 [Trichonephila clavipes]|nr:uncharacterized protein TNCV_1965311 [Trichonephila clavipes]
MSSSLMTEGLMQVVFNWAQMSFYWCGVEVRRGDQVSSSSLGHGSSIRSPFPEALVQSAMQEKMARKQDILVGVRNLVIGHWKEGELVRCMGKILKLSKSTVFNVIDSFKKTNSVENKRRSGRPQIFNERSEEVDCVR